MFPKHIPCPNCETATRVIVRTAAGGRIYYIGAKCHACGVYVQAAAHSHDNEERAQQNGLRELRRAWKHSKEEIDDLKKQNPRDDAAKIAKRYCESREIKRR